MRKKKKKKYVLVFLQKLNQGLLQIYEREGIHSENTHAPQYNIWKMKRY